MLYDGINSQCNVNWKNGNTILNFKIHYKNRFFYVTIIIIRERIRGIPFQICMSMNFIRVETSGPKCLSRISHGPLVVCGYQLTISLSYLHRSASISLNIWLFILYSTVWNKFNNSNTKENLIIKMPVKQH